MPIYTVPPSITALVVGFSRTTDSIDRGENCLVPLIAAVLFIFADNLLRATSALIALDEQVRVSRFLSFRVFWKLIRTIPALAATQAKSLVFFGSGWVVGDCLWPVICVVERLSGRPPFSVRAI